MRKKDSRKFIILKSFFIVVLVVSSFLTIISLMNNVVPSLIVNELQIVDVFLTKVTIIFSIAAIALLLFRKLWMPIRKDQNNVSNIMRKSWLFLKKRHVLFGWITAAAATAHSVYFLVFLPEQMDVVVSGSIVAIIMIILVILGQYLNNKTKLNPLIGKVHLWLGVIFFISLMYHFVDSHG
ncbi:hypothetical protein [Bacillus solimangrovi]|uniref:Ferric oxidoreductase domain-containing protein n=1 Tax=Bacillus solimangrovi TaxID=1305675 RepID=A0A1E5LJP8_9BACI|nr:hypothetical protein [Bacillus solimangrovi]OEH94291.1 hypothetical protein BFG57_08515 [Bacillus solimangrovi]